MLLRTLGELTLEGASFNRPKPLLLLAYLTLEGKKERRFLAELFWPAASNPRRSLSSALHQLRSGAPGAVEADDTWAWSELPCDAQGLLAATEGGEVSDLTRGPFLAGIDLEGVGVELEEWIYGTREFIASQVQQSLVSLAEQEAAKGLFAEAARRADAALDLGLANADPELLVRLHTLLLASGSLKAVEVQREAEGFELPFKTSADEARAALTQTGTRERMGVSSLPARGTTFVGRERELEELGQLLSQDAYRLITITGLGGSGKTRLALQLAQRLLAEGAFPDGVFFVALDALTNTTGIPFAIAESVGLNLSGDHGRLDPFEQVLGHLEDKSLLLILDNYEHLLEGASLVRELLGSCPHLKVLATSRERLKIGGESVFPLSGLLASPTEEAAQGSGGDSVRLFVQRAKSADLGFRLTPGNRADVLRVCELVGGSPLGIELAASWVQLLSPAEIADEITSNLDILATQARDVTDRHQSVRATLQHSWALLQPGEQGVLRALSVFAGGFRREAAAAVAGGSIPVLASLVDKSLVIVLPGGRYILHPLIMQFAQGKLSELPEEQSEAIERHARYYLEFLRQQERHIWDGGTPESVAAMTAEWENVSAAWRWAVVQRRPEQLKHCMQVISDFGMRMGRYQDTDALFSSVIEGFDEHDRDHHAVLGAAMIAQAGHSRSSDENIRLIERGAELLRPLNEKMVSLPIGLQFSGILLINKGAYEEARAQFEEAIDLAKRLQYDGLAADNMNFLAKIETILGGTEKADTLFEEAREIYRRMGNVGGLWFSYNQQAESLLAAGRAREAEALYEQGTLNYARSYAQGAMLPHVMHLIRQGEIAHEVGAFQEARSFCQEALQLTRDRGYKGFEVSAMMQLGRTAVAQGNEDEGLELFRQALRLALSQQMTAEAVRCLSFLPELLMLRDEDEMAVKVVSLVVHHPASTPWDRDRVRKVFETGEDRLSPEAAAIVREGGEDSTLEGIAAELLGVV